jgi:hypothetical protein
MQLNSIKKGTSMGIAPQIMNRKRNMRRNFTKTINRKRNIHGD